VAEIIQAKKVRKTKKLMELTVRMGDEERTIVSGIATDFEEAELVGKKVTLLANLKPRSLKGIESQGMILLGENQGGHLVFVGPEDQTTASGTPIK
jgi:methionyl-tRNA synthetase